MKTNWVIILACLAVFHTPDGQELKVDTRHIALIRPGENIKQHLAHGSNAVIFVDGKNFAITETAEQAQDAIHNCIDGSER